ncbi:MAG TPA: hypothetical protein VFN67_27710 [Polyangiales bacterium]|nr:hypothetical protein [Polyangiales bacterium]
MAGARDSYFGLRLVGVSLMVGAAGSGIIVLGSVTAPLPAALALGFEAAVPAFAAGVEGVLPVPVGGFEAGLPAPPFTCGAETLEPAAAGCIWPVRVWPAGALELDGLLAGVSAPHAIKVASTAHARR